MEPENSVMTRCHLKYEVNGKVEQCVKALGHAIGECQLTMWLAIKVPLLEVGIGTSVDGSMTIRRIL